ncbi:MULTISPECIES: hypothetical protein [Serratia]|uniref:hypothetical protein n=1 Tax=Serratia TaxID=613 RepID=UPI0008A84735|nr:hypothetical protein [Serratia marcescens]APS35688.1 hypothetical protein RN42_18435 [Serratia marcescens]OHT35370.1 hypothetical protein BGV45_07350 [Serratia marcescens]OHT37090.1 hypothetical protein BGV46_07345 [Serratia marcescens]
MTLIIAGYEKNQFSSDGTFFISDSAITRTIKDSKGDLLEVKTLLNGYRKLFAYEITVHYPKFDNSGFFERFYEKRNFGKCVVAFAGGKDTAHYILSEIELNLRNIKLSFDDNYLINVVNRYNESSLEKNRYLKGWNVDEYNLDSIDHLLTKEFVSESIRNSIETALASAREYKLDKSDFDDLKCEFIASIYCRKSSEHFLYKYTIGLELEYGIYVPQVKMEKVAKNTIAFIGVRKYGEQLIELHEGFISNPENTVSLSGHYIDIIGEYLDDKDELCSDDWKEMKSPFSYLLSEFMDVVTECCNEMNRVIDFPVFTLRIDQGDISLGKFMGGPDE